MFGKGLARASRFIFYRRILALLVSIFFMQLLGSIMPASAADFSSPAFRRVWERADFPVISNQASRGFLWGPAPFANSFEAYAESPNGQRRVDYFDKARMEITRPDLNASQDYYVTNGLIVKEMTSGLVQNGDNSFVQRFPAYNVPVAGDPFEYNADAPTYASFYALNSFYVLDDKTQTFGFTPILSKQPNRINERVAETISKGGSVGRNDLLSSLEGINYVYYERTLGHNIPKIFWDFLNQTGPILVGGNIVFGPVFDWVSTMGYPITDAYWITTKVNGNPRDVMVQLFERRILTYTPTNPEPYKVEMGNVGRHYYNWRYSPVYDIGLPQQSNADVKPEAGFPGTAHAIRVYRFIQGESISVTVATPDGKPCGDCTTLINYVPTGFGFQTFQVNTFGFRPGQYTLYFKGQTSGNEAKAYIFVIGIPGFNLPPS